MNDYKTLIRTDYTHFQPRSLLSMPVAVLLGVSLKAADVLQSMQIYTVFDLGTSRLFATARMLADAFQENGGLFQRHGRVTADLLDNAALGLTPEHLGGQGIEIIDGIGPNLGPMIREALFVETVHELAHWPPYVAARRLVTATLTPEQLETFDPEAPADLIPTSGKHPTERVSYTTVVISSVDGANLKDLEGPIDIAALGPGLNLNTKPATGAIITTEQTWYAQGVALGSLLHSVALAPGESTRIAMVDWTRRTRVQTDETTTQEESLTNQTDHNRSISEVTQAVAHEKLHGFSTSTSLGLSGNAGFAAGFAALPLMAQGLSAGGAATYGRATTVSGSEGQRNLSADMTQDISDQTLQVASAVRSRRASVVQEVTQQETEQLRTRTITNYNHMHALSIQYYEIVQIYRMTTRVSKVDRCLFIPMKVIDDWSADLIDRFRGILIRALPEGSLRKALLEGADLVEIQRHNLLGPSPQNFPGRVSEATLTETLENARELTGRQVAEDIAALWRLPAETKLVGFTATGSETWRSAVIRLRDGATHTVAPGATLEPLLLSDIQAIDLSFDNITFKRLNATGYDPDHDPSYYYSWLGLKVQCRLRLRFGGLEFEHWLVSQAPHSDWYKTYMQEERASEFDEGPDRPAYRVTVHFPTLVISPRGVAVGQRLIDHFMQNRVYYSQVIWLNMDTPSLTILLSGYKYKGVPILQRIDPLPVAVTGNYLGFRMHVDPQVDPQWRQWLEDHGFVDKGGYTLKNSAVHDTVPLPSGGVFAEAVLGRFNAAEKLDMTRFWNWQDSPIPFAAPDIAALQAGGKTQTLQPPTGTLEPAVIQQAAPTSLPDPQGLTAMIQALASANLFRDITGTAQNVALAQAAMQAASVAATAAGAQAGTNMETAAKYSVEAIKALAGLATQLNGGASGVKPPAAAAFSPTDRNALLEGMRKAGQAVGPVGGGAAPTGSPTPPAGTIPSVNDEIMKALQNLFGTGGHLPTETEGEDGQKPPKTSKKTTGPGLVRGTIDSEILLANFDIDSAQLKPAHEEALDAIVYALQTEELRITELVGRASQTGPDADNLKLSERRIDAVLKYIEARHALQDMPVTRPLGESDPLEVHGPLENYVDRSVQIRFTVTGDFPVRGEPFTEENPTIPRYTLWSIRVKTSEGSNQIGGKNILGTPYKVELKNRQTQEVLPGQINAAGVGVTVNIFNRQREWSDWVDFETIPITNDEWHNVMARITRAEANLYLVNADSMLLYFYGVMAADDTLTIESTFRLGGASDNAVGLRTEAALHGHLKLDKFVGEE